ncbi:MAG: hypothetical protein JWM81_802 [Candidatus Saccharibacteria bacterium]|nr:hypothetical protein [Candidatus Saccharibacteria bacterium]
MSTENYYEPTPDAATLERMALQTRAYSLLRLTVENSYVASPGDEPLVELTRVVTAPPNYRFDIRCSDRHGRALLLPAHPWDALRMQPASDQVIGVGAQLAAKHLVATFNERGARVWAVDPDHERGFLLGQRPSYVITKLADSNLVGRPADLPDPRYDLSMPDGPPLAA